MKRLIVLCVVFVLVISTVGCKQSEPKIQYETSSNEQKDNNAQSSSINITDFSFSSDGKIINEAPKDKFTSPIECDYNGEKLAVSAPKFTGLPVESVYSYKDYYSFIDGTVIFNASTSDGTVYFLVDKNGVVVNANSDLMKLNSGRDTAKYMQSPIGEQAELGTGLKGTVVGDEVAVVQLGESENSAQYLYSLSGEVRSKGYDSIGYFYNGLALIEKDNKIGLIDEKGNEVLSPTISFDTVKYPPTEREFFACFMTEDAFVLPIGGEFAIINIVRYNNHTEN